ncbi:T9SS type A sorting domain-containing protein [Lewinella sp. JB7]|uniref:T9SS type A sorting domain-containing protein n=1 Tax=Lewinella sp. JB7 TaxID=2962887 RepID=UPI0020C9FC5B|nr:T9SS type A sorting domain-containing protein [Lewinella sp. JB7]MCP9236798.1 T9SS type A sorting domain-containing protein [Lewinella sp. JB7]
MNNLYTKRLVMTLVLGLSSLSLLFAANIVVTTSANSGPGSLRQAVMDAAPGDEITFAVATNFKNFNLLSEIKIDKDLTIRGNGWPRTILTGNQTNRVFNIMGGARVIISQLRMVNGFTKESGGALQNVDGTVYLRQVFIKSSRAQGMMVGQGGGAIYNTGKMYLREVMLTRNTALGEKGSGGALLNGSGGTLEMVSCLVAENKANRAGGGIEDASGGGTDVVISRSHINENVVFTAPGNGGGIHVGGDGILNIDESEVNGNMAGAEGGGIWIGTGKLRIMATEVDNNVAKGDDPDQGGGGLYNDGGHMYVGPGTMVTNNRATGKSGSGGGILNAAGGSLAVVEAHVMNNVANRAGGGIEDASGAPSRAYAVDAMIDNNQVFNSPGNGGGVHVGGDGDFSMLGGSVSGNMAGAEGGGLWNNVGKMTVRNVMVHGNVAMGSDADQGGGGIYNNGGTLAIGYETKIMNNRATGASGSGGGVLNATGGTLRVNDAVVSGNSANRAGAGIEDASGAGTVFYVTYSVIDSNIVANRPGNGGGIHVGSDGDLSVLGGSVSGNCAGAEGGGLWNNTGIMTIIGTRVHGNIAQGNDPDHGGGGIYNNGGTLLVGPLTHVTYNRATGTSGSGGGLLSTGGDVGVAGAYFADNLSNRAGGAVEVIDGTYSSAETHYVNNSTGSAPGNGGAFHVTGNDATVTFVGGSVVGNHAAHEGGGLWNQAGTEMNVVGVNILGNSVTGSDQGVSGGGVYNNGGELFVSFSTIAGNSATGGPKTVGGGITNATGGELTLILSTVSGNFTEGWGGGVANAGAADLDKVTITMNGAATGGGYMQPVTGSSLLITGTAISDNVAVVYPDFGAPMGMVNSNGYNLISDDSGNQFPAGPTDKEGMSANFGPLADNGGPTLTHMPMCPSPVIDMGDPDDRSRDQVGHRVFGDRRDIGSYERQSYCGSGPATRPVAGTEVRDRLEVFPNPATSDFLDVLIPTRFGANVTLRIVSGEGRTTSEVRTTTAKHRLDLAGLLPGAYTLQVIGDGATESMRFVVAR